MGASSVTGTGLGSAEGADRGRKEMTIGVEKLLGPRVVTAGRVALVGGAGTVVLPKLPGVVGDYAVMAVNEGAASAVRAYLTFNTNDTTVTISSGAGTDTVSWSIIKIGPANK